MHLRSLEKNISRGGQSNPQRGDKKVSHPMLHSQFQSLPHTKDRCLRKVPQVRNIFFTWYFYTANSKMLEYIFIIFLAKRSLEVNYIYKGRWHISADLPRIQPPRLVSDPKDVVSLLIFDRSTCFNTLPYSDWPRQ